jgi:hypothetical protein
MIGAQLRGVKDEVARWRAIGQRPAFWIRDDDADAMCGKLERLTAIAIRHGVSVGLAFVPGLLAADLVPFLRRQSGKLYPLCHGWKHVNYASPDNPSEFGSNRPHPAARLDAVRALETFRQHFPNVPAVFVPPFNRIAPQMIDALTGIGFAGLSAAPRPLERRMARLVGRLAWAAPTVNIAWRGSLPRIDAHVDLIDWRSGSARDLNAVAEALLGQLRLRRRAFLPARAPIGLLTHHRVHDEPIWQLLEALIVFLKDELGGEFVDVERMFHPRNSSSVASSAAGAI